MSKAVTNEGLYIPVAATIESIVNETENVKTFRIRADKESFSFLAGQFCLVSFFGAGESVFAISSAPHEAPILEFSVQRLGENTTALHNLSVNDMVGLRGPYGNHFPIDAIKGHDVLAIAGGIGLAPLRSLMRSLLNKRDDYGRLTLIYGAKTPDDICFMRELKRWVREETVDVILTIDNPAPGWENEVGFVPDIITKIRPDNENTKAIVCGPPIMIDKSINSLRQLGFQDSQILTTLERRMKCGVGHCGHCNIGDCYVCVEGPVFTVEQIGKMQADF